MKKKTLLSSILTIALCLSLIAGSTLALFTDESKVSFAVTSGKVDVVASIDQDSLQTYSMDVEQEAGKFENGGTASFTDSAALALNLVTPGDKARFDINVTNNSNVNIQYRVRMAITYDAMAENAEASLALAEALVATVEANGTSYQVNSSERVTAWWSVDAFDKIDDVTVTVELPVDTDNGAQDGSVEVAVVIDAVQGNGAVGGEVLMDGFAYDTLADALSASVGGETIEIYGEHSLAGVPGTSKITDLKDVTIVGVSEGTVLNFVNAEGSNVTGTGSFNNVNLKNLTVEDMTFYTAENGENEWEFTYLEFGGNNSFENVRFNDGIMVENGHSEFSECTFTGINNNSSSYGDTTMYGAWVYTGSANFDSCEFVGTRGLKVADMYDGSDVTEVTVDRCLFNNLSEKPGVAVDNRKGSLNLTIKNSTFFNCKTGDGEANSANGVPYIYENDNRTPDTTTITLENNTVISPNLTTVEISDVKTLKAFATAVNGGANYKGKTILLTSDIDLENIEWTPIGNSSNSFQGTFDGQNHTISNLNVSMAGKSNAGLFGFTTNGAIKNIVIENATVTGRLNVGVVAGTPYTSTYDNITVKGHVEVNGMSYVGGVFGKNVYANVSNVTVDVDGTSYVYADSVENGLGYRTYVGGVMGFMGEGWHTVSNVYSNIDVIGTVCDVGGITGIAHYGNTFKNCVCTGDVTLIGEDVEYGGIAGVWHNGGSNVTFEYCDFTGTITVNCEKVARCLVNSAYSTTGTGELIIKNYETREEIAAGFYKVTGNNTTWYEIEGADGMFSFAKQINEGNNSFSGSTVKLMGNVDLNNAAWTPIGQTGATEFKGVFDGRGNTIYNLNIDSSANTDGHYSSGLFGWIEDHGNGIVVKNLIVDGATVKGNHNVAVIVGYSYGGDVINCHVKNANILCTHANDDACGDKCGIIGGYVADESKIIDCRAQDSTVKAGRDAGQLIGCGYTSSISGCSAENVTVNANGDCTGANINNDLIGRVMN